MVIKYGYQSKPDGLTVWSDSDFAGCEKSRKSTSAGVAMHGDHVIKTWSSNQSVIALSSGEAEYYALVKGASVGLGIKALSGDLGVTYMSPTDVKSDASAAIGIANRVGLGKVRHIEVNQLWLQEKVAKGVINIIKVGTDDNLADALTKAVSAESMMKHLTGIGAMICGGRHNLAPKTEYKASHNDNAKK